MTPDNHSERLARVEDAVIQHTVDFREVRQHMGRLADAFVELAKHGEKLAGVEKIVTEVNDQDRRLRAVEIEIPALKETRGWIVKIFIGVASAVGMALLGLVLIKP